MIKMMSEYDNISTDDDDPREWWIVIVSCCLIVCIKITTIAEVNNYHGIRASLDSSQ